MYKRQQIQTALSTRSWIAFVHRAPGINPGSNVTGQTTLSELFDKLKGDGILHKILPNCKGIFTLSNYLETFVNNYMRRCHLRVRTETLWHPKELTVQFDIDRYLGNRDRKVAHIGKYLRDVETFKRLTVPPNYSKTIVNGNLSDSGYEKTLTSSVVFVNLTDASASNLIVECISSSTPIIVNRIPAVEEYLGENYPLFYSSTDELSNNIKSLLSDAAIREAHLYLRGLDRTPSVSYTHLYSC